MENTEVLTAKQKKFLKGLGHPLKAVIQIGKEGMSERLLEAVRIELKNHELIKVKIGRNCGLEKDETATKLIGAADCLHVQTIGKTILLYKENPKRKKEERIYLP